MRTLAEFAENGERSGAAYMRAYRWAKRLGLDTGIRGGAYQGRPGSHPATFTDREMLAIRTAIAVARSDQAASGPDPASAGLHAGRAVLGSTGGWLFANPQRAAVTAGPDQLLAWWIAEGRPTGSFLNLATLPDPRIAA